MTGRLRVLLHATAPEEDPGAVEHAYHRISRALAGTPGLLGNELLTSALEPGRFIVMSEWESAEAFRTWEEGAGHRGTTAPLRPYQDRAMDRPFGIYEVTAAY
ncbi:antibiotic biosynthesis monooxygenase [Actinomadura sp. CNU-125]|uniref:antibiotic biosynthesis monooxygenase family protein n=1 Tax=Actinomadura sp. CNU-125 TaxID=1904961 RepID=UPI00095A8954|nr:antibiotic biosynthesis monooxygenase [Actinomadura sp. CNU-125]OLT25797.1 antibiotic biosynthesis monooxygenase [Actinomadura sp. CNU-125]